ncbi:MAG: ROK family protein [Candidatus Riflebacteria bacterium]|nr:ROK family protein [Candidatus Riflebacteria bacterium]
MSDKVKNKKENFIGIDIGGSKIMAALFNNEFKILSTKREKFKERTNITGGIEFIKKLVSEVLVGANLKIDSICGIGVGCPGPLDIDKGLVFEAPNLGWKNVPLKEILTREFGCQVRIANDVDAGTFGEYRFGAGKDARCVLGVFPGTGIGGGCVYEGKLFRGKTGSCMEIGHIQVQKDGPLCGCGKHGCIEAFAGRLAIAAAASVAAFRGQAPYLMEDTGGEIAKIRSKSIARAISAGDTVIEHIVRDSAKKLGSVIASVVSTIAPDIVVLGGGLVEAMPAIYLKEISAAIKEEAVEFLATDVKVAVAKLGDEAGVLGAAALIAEEAAK